MTVARINLTDDKHFVFLKLKDNDKDYYVRFASEDENEVNWNARDAITLADQIWGDYEIVSKLLVTANMDCYSNTDRTKRDFAIDLLQEKL